MAERELVIVDVREDLRAGRHPLARILAAAKALVGGQDLLLRSTFEPVPLYKVLAVRGFDHEARQLTPGDWEIRFRRRSRAAKSLPRPAGRPNPGPTDPPPATGTPPGGDAVPWVRLDNRGLEPPEPMIRTLAALETLAAGSVLEIHNDRRPMFLYPHLQERGAQYETVDQTDGSALVRIWAERPAGAAGAP